MTIKVGSRTSKLALKQVDIVMKTIGISDYEIIKIDTVGDQISRQNKVQFDKKILLMILIVFLLITKLILLFTQRKICQLLQISLNWMKFTFQMI